MVHIDIVTNFRYDLHIFIISLEKLAMLSHSILQLLEFNLQGGTYASMSRVFQQGSNTSRLLQIHGKGEASMEVRTLWSCYSLSIGSQTIQA